MCHLCHQPGKLQDSARHGSLGINLTPLPNPISFLLQLMPEFVAWRVSFYVPAVAQIMIGLTILIFGQDLPDGNYADLVAAGKKDKAKSHMEFLAVSCDQCYL
jgi:NNP family nitrate/nitrite transporter-like MFS transporter